MRIYTSLSMAFSRGELESKVSDEGDNINEHLIKLIRWEDRVNKEKHIRETTGKLIAIQSWKCRSKIKPKDYYNWIFAERHLPYIEKLWTSYIDNTLYKYSKLPVKKDYIETFRLVNSLLKKVSIDMQRNNFSDLKDYSEIE